MSVSHSEMKDCLRKLECRTVHQADKITEYMLPGTKFAFYLHDDKSTAQMVLPPALEVFRDMLVAIPGTISKYQYFHHAGMSRFPKKTHGGKKEIHYGLSFEFENDIAVEKFIHQLITIVSQ